MNTNDTDLSRRSFLKTSASIGAALAAGMYPGLSFGFKGTRAGTLDAALELLNMWGKTPEPVIKLYSAVYGVLAKSPMAGFAEVAKDETVQKLCKEQGILHLGGPMLGCISEDRATVWLRTVKPATVEVKATIDGTEKTFGPVTSTPESDLTALVKVTGLTVGSKTPYKVFVDGKEIAIPKHAMITTSPKADAAKTRIAFGTCQHRWGLGNEKMTNVILERKPHAMLMYGDVAAQDRKNNFAMARADYALRDFHPAWQNLVCSTPIYASWDDHDYYANDAWGIPRGATDKDRRGVRKVFTQAWNNPYYGLGDEGGGIFQHTRIGPCDVIMTDNRYFREKSGKHCFLGKEQMAWLKKTLKACKGPFIIMSCGSMWSDFVSNGKDSWGKFDPQAREEIFSLIEAEKIPGVLLISGDRHGARVFTIPRPSGYKFYEFEPASLGSRTGPAATSAKWKSQLYGTSGKYAFGEFTCDTALKDPEVTFKLISEQAKTLYELTLKRSQLTPGKGKQP